MQLVAEEDKCSVPRCVSEMKLGKQLEWWMERMVGVDEGSSKIQTLTCVYRQTTMARVNTCLFYSLIYLLIKLRSALNTQTENISSWVERVLMHD